MHLRSINVRHTVSEVPEDDPIFCRHYCLLRDMRQFRGQMTIAEKGDWRLCETGAGCPLCVDKWPAMRCGTSTLSNRGTPPPHLHHAARCGGPWTVGSHRHRRHVLPIDNPHSIISASAQVCSSKSLRVEP